jgi:hypothetical protein
VEGASAMQGRITWKAVPWQSIQGGGTCSGQQARVAAPAEQSLHRGNHGGKKAHRWLHVSHTHGVVSRRLALARQRRRQHCRVAKACARGGGRPSVQTGKMA